MTCFPKPNIPLKNIVVLEGGGSFFQNVILKQPEWRFQTHSPNSANLIMPSSPDSVMK